MKKIFKIFLLIFFLTFLLGSFSFAQRPLEIEYPPMGGVPITTKTMLPEYIKYFFNFSIALAGFIAFVALVLGGFRFITSAGDPTKLSDARNQVLAGFLGLIILLSSVLILTTINPQLIILKAPGIRALQGVILYSGECQKTLTPTGEEGKDFLKVGASKNIIRPPFSVQNIYFINSSKDLRLELFSSENYQGSPSFDSDTGDFPAEACKSLTGSISSARITWKTPGVYLYAGTNYTDQSVYYPTSTAAFTQDKFDDKTKSIKIRNRTECKERDTEGKCLKEEEVEKLGAILHEDQNFEGKASVFLEDKSNLSGTEVGNNNADSLTIFQQNPTGKEGVITLCRNPDCEKEKGKNAKFWFRFGERISVPGYDSNIVRGIPDLTKHQWLDENGKATGEYIGVAGLTLTRCGVGVIVGQCPPGVSAVYIDEGSDYLVILFQEKNYTGDALILRKSISNLKPTNFNDDVASIMIIKGN